MDQWEFKKNGEEFKNSIAEKTRELHRGLQSFTLENPEYSEIKLEDESYFLPATKTITIESPDESKHYSMEIRQRKNGEPAHVYFGTSQTNFYDKGSLIQGYKSKPFGNHTKLHDRLYLRVDENGNVPYFSRHAVYENKYTGTKNGLRILEQLEFDKSLLGLSPSCHVIRCDFDQGAGFASCDYQSALLIPVNPYFDNKGEISYKTDLDKIRVIKGEGDAHFLEGSFVNIDGVELEWLDFLSSQGNDVIRWKRLEIYRKTKHGQSDILGLNTRTLFKEFDAILDHKKLQKVAEQYEEREPQSVAGWLNTGFYLRRIKHEEF
jgi:hypothetical protein